jgi:hypothetical protein
MFKCTHTSHVCNMCVYTHKDTGTCLGGDAGVHARGTVYLILIYTVHGTCSVGLNVFYKTDFTKFQKISYFQCTSTVAKLQ